MGQTAPQHAPPRHVERLTVPWWWWPVSLGLAGLLAAEVYLGRPGPATWVPYALLLPLPLWGLLRLGRIRVAVEHGELRVDDAHLPVRFIADVTALDPTGKSDLLGPYAEPYAFVIQRPWIPGAVQVRLADPDDPTPYWIISTRQPDSLAAALLAERATTPADRR